MEKKQRPFITTDDFAPLPSKPNTITNKQDYSRTINTLPRHYNTHSTSGTIQTYLTQKESKLVTKKLSPTKKENTNYSNLYNET